MSHGVTLDVSRPGKPTDDAFIEAFNGRFRAKCPNAALAVRAGLIDPQQERRPVA